MIDESRVFVGNDANGEALYVGDEVQLINHPLINSNVVGLRRTIHSTTLRYPPPDFLFHAFGGEGWCELVTPTGRHHGSHSCTMVKVKNGG